MLKIRKFLSYNKCIKCGKEYLSFQGRNINKEKDWICSSCTSVLGYSTRNSNTLGKKTEMSFSFEFETSRRSMVLYELYKYGFIACYDSSISGSEWKSPIFNNRKSFHNVCKKINKFRKFVDSRCGTHLHVGTPYKSVIREYENEIFQPILNEMKEKKEDTISFWGRYFTGYSDSIIRDSRYNSFNTRSSVETLEFRLLKFVNAEQYIKACDFCIWATRTINYYVRQSNFNSQRATKLGNVILKKYKEVLYKNVSISANE